MEGVIFDGNFMLNITQTRENNENFIMYDSCIKGHFEKIFVIKIGCNSRFMRYGYRLEISDSTLPYFLVSKENSKRVELNVSIIKWFK